MKHLFFVVSSITTVGCGLAFALGACGGASEDSAVVAPDRDGGGSSSSSGSTTSSGASTTSSGGSTSSSGGTTDGGGGNDSAGGGDGSTPNKISCGTATCTTPTQKCCTTFSQGGGATATCIPAADNCQGANQACDDKTDCPANQICCAGGGSGGGGGGFAATCQADCARGIQLCKAANECVDGGTCQTYTCFGQQASLCRKPQFGCQ